MKPGHGQTPTFTVRTYCSSSRSVCFDVAYVYLSEYAAGTGIIFRLHKMRRLSAAFSTELTAAEVAKARSFSEYLLTVVSKTNASS